MTATPVKGMTKNRNKRINRIEEPEISNIGGCEICKALILLSSTRRELRALCRQYLQQPCNHSPQRLVGVDLEKWRDRAQIQSENASRGLFNFRDSHRRESFTCLTL